MGKNKNVKRPITGVLPFLRFAIDRGIESRTIMNGTSLSENDFLDPKNEIPLSEELKMVRNLIALFPAHETAWELGRYYFARAHDTLGNLMDYAPTVGDIISSWIEYAGLLHIYFRLNLKASGDLMRLHLEKKYCLPDDLLPFLLERDYVVGKSIFDKKLPGFTRKYTTLLSFTHEPRTDLQKYKEIFADTVLFNQQVTFIEFKKVALKIFLPGSDPHKFELFRQQCQAESSLRDEARFFLSDKVRVLLNEENGRINSSDMAKKFNMSERSLRQQLAVEGNSFRKIRNQYIFQKSLNLLKNQDYNIDEISYFLGYTETSAFSRTFHKWTGLSPSKYRKKFYKIS